jgi:hypothetical protein
MFHARCYALQPGNYPHLIEPISAHLSDIPADRPSAGNGREVHAWNGVVL